MITVADVLALDQLALEPVHLPHPEAAVRWVATSELVDPSPFLEGGELLLTTGLSTQDWESEWDEYVANLAEAGVVGLGLGSGLTHPRAPTALVRACRRHRVNLIEVPRPTAFVAVSRATAQLLEEAERHAARQSLAMQRELTAAALTAPDGEALPGRLADLVDGAALLLAPDGHPLTTPSGPRTENLDISALTAELARIRPQGLRAASSLSSPAGTTLLHPVGVRPRPTAYLAVLLPGRPTEARRSAVRTAVSLLGLASERAEQRRDSDRALRTRAMELLLSGDPRGARLVLGALSAPVPLPRRATVIRAAPHHPAPLDDIRDQHEADRMLVAVIDDELCLIVPAGTETDHAEALVEAGLLVGVGEPAGLSALPHAHETAGHALARTSAASPAVSWARVVRGGVLGLLDTDEATAFATDLLAPLGSELRSTLLSFLKHHGSRLKAAEELGIHRNTVRHRLTQIEALTGLTLDDPTDRVSAWVSLHVLPQSSWSEGAGRRAGDRSTTPSRSAGGSRSRPHGRPADRGGGRPSRRGHPR